MHLVLDLQACQSASRFRGIGRFSLSLAKAMVARPRNHEITILLSDAMGEPIEDLRSQFADLIPQSRIRTWAAVAPTAYLHPDNRFRQRASEALRLQVLRQLKPDLVHVASLIEGWGDDFAATIADDTPFPTAVTFYDLIPLAHQKTYLTDPLLRAWYMEKIGFLRHGDMLLGISNFACMEARELLGIPAERVVNISGAADDIFRRLENAEALRPDLMARYDLHRPFIMYAGGFDPRKNISALIRAFALLPQELRSAYQLAIVGGVSPPEHQALVTQMVASGLDASEVVFTGYVSDEELIKLYNLCDLYVFPSLQEGFGLPALEAMLCGAAVIGSNTSSLPEVIGRADALFDPRDEHSIARKMVQALTDHSFRTSLREHARQQPVKFSWQESARRALDAFEAVHGRSCSATAKPKARRESGNGKVAFLPAPNSQVPSKEFGKVRIYADSDCRGIPQSGRPIERLRLERDRFARVVVELTDDAYCAKTLALAAEGDADLLLSDHNIGNVLAALANEPGTRSLLIELMYRSNGYSAVRSAIDANFSAEALNRLFTLHGLAALGGCQVLARENDGAEMSPGVTWRNHVREALLDLRGVKEANEASEQDWQRVAKAIARNILQHGTSRQWLVDVSILSMRDAGTGIQRVVRRVLDELMASPPPGYRLEPVCLGEDGVFRYARSYCAQRYFPGVALPADEPVEFGDGDIYLGLDLNEILIPAYKSAFCELRNRGIKQYFVVYDLLPILRPDCFDPLLLSFFRAWCESIAELADGILCISRSVADQFECWLHQGRPGRKRPLGIGYFHLGADFGDEQELPAGIYESRLPDGLANRPTVLMVGTLEPRKGHAQVLRAFERLWERGIELNLLIIGRPGWLSEAMIQQLRGHPEHGSRLHWLDDADDALLRAAYRRASALLMASEGEGFGLPLIEAAHYDLPLIVRDLPVFREVAGERAFYFSGLNPDDLASALQEWLRLDAEGRAPQSNGIQWLTWRESAAQLVDVVRNGRWVHTWRAGTIRRHPAYDHRLSTQVGRLVRGRLQSTAQSGWLLYGPYLPLEAGRYRVRLFGGWNLACGSAWAGMAVGAAGTPVIRKSLVPVVSRDPTVLVELDVTLPTGVSDYQVRVFVDEQASLWIEEVVIEPWPVDSEGNRPGQERAGTDSSRGGAGMVGAETNLSTGIDA
ncbi:MAG: glycosyltransferase family 4 protein [Rhodanobacteraceae bacterium]